jgi:putative inorganic carbon (HCO3(-)) transporter
MLGERELSFTMVAKSMSRRRTGQQPRAWLNRLLWWEPFWVLGLAPSLLFTEYFWEPTLRPLLIVALFLFWPLRLKAEQPLLPRGAAGWFLGFLLLWLLVTIGRSANSNLSWEIAGYLYLALVGFVALIHWPPLRKQPAGLALLLMMVGVGLAVVGPEAFSVNPDKMLDAYQTEEFSLVDPTLEGETINPNILGTALALILPLGLALALHWSWARWRWLPLLLWAPILIMGNGLLLSQSRSSWLALGVAGLLLFWWLLTRSAITTAGSVRNRLRWRRILALLVVVVLLAALAFLWRAGAINRWVTPELQQSTQTSLIRRMEIWRLSLALVGNNPLTGIGLGNYEAAFTAAFPTLPLSQGRLAPPHAHNLFLQLALDLGLPGLLAYVGLGALLFSQLLRRLHQPPDGRQVLAHSAAAQSVAIGVSSALAAMLLVGCFDNALWGTKLTVIPWSLFALALIVGEVEEPNASRS